MSKRSFVTPARLGWSACSLVLAVSFIGCGGAPGDESESDTEAVEARSDALQETCTTYDVLHVENGVSMYCMNRECVKPNGCQWNHLTCEDGFDETNESQCWGSPVEGCFDDW